MSADSRRIPVGSINVAALSAILRVNVAGYTVAAFEAVPRYGASLGSWVCKIQQSITSTPNDFTTPISFTSSILYVGSQDLTTVDTLSFVNTTAGNSGIVDIWAIVKADN